MVSAVTVALAAAMTRAAGTNGLQRTTNMICKFSTWLNVEANLSMGADHPRSTSSVTTATHST